MHKTSEDVCLPHVSLQITGREHLAVSSRLDFICLDNGEIDETIARGKHCSDTVMQLGS
jgi:hypothetical protein